MTFIELGMWLSLALVFYSYLGYGIALFVLVLLKRAVKGREGRSDPDPPRLTVVVAAYNEVDFIREKIRNTLGLDYPEDRIEFLFVTDGSDDGTEEIVREYPRVRLMHTAERAGKIAAVQRAMPHVRTPIVVFTDANTFLNDEALLRIVRHFEDPAVGAVAGEKRVMSREADAANASGEGLYWRYESTLKRWDSELYSVVGAAGELFAIRTELFEDVPPDTIIEDFYITLRIAERGYRVRYEPSAYAMEGPSASTREELKRKVRIAAGGLQAIVRLRGLLNPFRHGILTFQYVSHRVLRWTLAPLGLVVMLLANLALVSRQPALYGALLVGQLSFYLAAGAGFLLDLRSKQMKLLTVPYYFCMMNVAVVLGMFRYFRGSQSVVWERARRA